MQENGLSLGAERSKVLTRVADTVGQVWASFDKARDVEPAVSERINAILQEPLPIQGSTWEVPFNDAVEILDQSTAQSRPRFFAYIGSSGLETGAIADFLAASYDINLAVDALAASRLEEQASRWVSEFIGFSDARGLFTSGGTVSNITALAAARQKADPDSRQQGLTKSLTVYCSEEAHYSNKRAVELLGLGSSSLRAIPITASHQIDTRELENQIRKDIASGYVPMAIIASAGTTLTGSVDNLQEIARIGRDYAVWVHVDGAYGVPAARSRNAGHFFKGLNLCDSVTIDAHKWLFVPKACSLVLMKDYAALHATFSHNEAYMPHEKEEPNPVDVTLEYSRPLRALKLWLGFKTHGADAFAAAISENIGLAHYAYEKARANPKYRTLEFAPQLSIVPMQYLGPDGSYDSDFNSKLCEAIKKDGRVYLSPAQIAGESWLRPCFTNFRTNRDDVDELFTVIEDVAARIS